MGRAKPVPGNRKTAPGKALPQKGTAPRKASRTPPPKTQVFERNDAYRFTRGFARKIDAKTARDRYKLNPEGILSPGKTGQNLVWLSPDGTKLLTNQEANRNNSRRRAALTLSDAWKDLKTVDGTVAGKLGWNGFQKLMRDIHGNKIKVLTRLESLGVNVATVAELARASEGEAGENNAWGDSH